MRRRLDSDRPWGIRYRSKSGKGHRQAWRLRRDCRGNDFLDQRQNKRASKPRRWIEKNEKREKKRKVSGKLSTAPRSACRVSVARFGPGPFLWLKGGCGRGRMGVTSAVCLLEHDRPYTFSVVDTVGQQAWVWRCIKTEYKTAECENVVDLNDEEKQFFPRRTCRWHEIFLTTSAMKYSGINTLKLLLAPYLSLSLSLSLSPLCCSKMKVITPTLSPLSINVWWSICGPQSNWR